MFAPKTICFDLNKTLINENAWLILNTALGVTKQEDDILMDWGKRGIINDTIGQQLLLKIYKTSQKHSKKNISEILFKYTYVNGAREIISKLLSQGHKILLISGSMDILVEHVAEELGITTWYANNSFIFDENDYLIDIKTHANDYVAKVEQLEDYCAKNNCAMTDIYCVGDGDNDSELFKATGKGITFRGSKIEKEAWKVIDELQELEGIFQ